MPKKNPISQEQQNQKKYYNRIAATYDRHYVNPFALRYRFDLYNRMCETLDLKSLNVLDAMCGGGPNTEYFLARGSKVTGVDISEEQCKIYQSRFPQAKTLCAPITQTNLPNESFDFIVTESLHHLHPEVNKGIRELHRLLKPGGYFMIWEPTTGSILDLARQMWQRLDKDYFQHNEKSLDLNRIITDHDERFSLLRKVYGGNLGYLLVHSSMLFRIPVSLLKFYAPALLWIDRCIEVIQTKISACWFIALFQKK